MKKFALAIAALTLAAVAGATQPINLGDDNRTYNSPTAAAAAAAQANAAAIAAQLQAQIQAQRQAQRQQQRQAQRQTATGGASGGNTISTGGVSLAVEGDKGDTVYAPAQERAPVATAYAPALATSNGTCMGSTSAGGQGSAFGLSFGTTWTDASCDTRYDAEALRAAGQPRAALARLCQKADIAKSMEAAGTPCPNAKGTNVSVGAPITDKEDVALRSGEPLDPFVRSRLGLPPLK